VPQHHDGAGVMRLCEPPDESAARCPWRKITRYIQSRRRMNGLCLEQAILMRPLDTSAQEDQLGCTVSVPRFTAALC
jgi:hypothetical protein